MISGTGLGNPVTMLPKFHSVRVPHSGHSSLEFVFAFYGLLYSVVRWMLAVIWELGVKFFCFLRGGGD